MEKVLSQNLKELATVLNSNDVKYMFVGGIAVSFYAKPRPYTNMPPGIDYDVDIWYSATIGNFTNLTNAIAQLLPELKVDLILNKKTTGREKDNHDITNLNKNSYNGFSK